MKATSLLDLYTVCAYSWSMNYEWDKQKESINIQKHGVDFSDAVIALEDESALTIEDKDHYEQRFKTLAWVPF